MLHWKRAALFVSTAATLGIAVVVGASAGAQGRTGLHTAGSEAVLLGSVSGGGIDAIAGGAQASGRGSRRRCAARRARRDGRRRHPRGTTAGLPGPSARALGKLGAVGLVEEGAGWLRLHRLLVQFVRQEALDPRARWAVDQVVIDCGRAAAGRHLSGAALSAVVPHWDPITPRLPRASTARRSCSANRAPWRPPGPPSQAGGCGGARREPHRPSPA